MAFTEEYLTIQLAGATEEIDIPWIDICSIIPARLVETRLEMTERMTRKPERGYSRYERVFKTKQ